MGQNLKVVIALVFIAVLGWVLLQPVFDAVEEGPTVYRPANEQTSSEEPSAPSPETSPEPTPSQEEAGLPEEFRRLDLLARVPASCRDVVAPTSSDAAVDRGRVVVTGPLTGGLEELPGEQLMGVGINGAVAVGSGRGDGYRGVPATAGVPKLDGAGLVVWSPTSACGLAVDLDGGLLTFPPKRVLLAEEVFGAAYSPDGNKLAVVTKEELASSIWIGDLRGRSLREVVREKAGDDLYIRAWSSDGRTIFYTVRESGLRFVTSSEPPQSGRLTTQAVEQLEQCGDRLLAVSSGAIVEVDTTGLDELATSGPEGYRYISCSPDGSFIAAIGTQGLVLLDSDGSLLRDLTQDSGFTDVFVDWGRQGAGLIFGRVRTGGDPTAAELWYIPEGGSPRSTGITYRHGPTAVDWAASPPTGLP